MFPYQNGIEHSVHLINPFSHMSLKICIIDLNLLTKNCLEINSIFCHQTFVEFGDNICPSDS